MVHNQILEELKKFADGQLPFQNFEQWLLSRLQQILDSREDRAIDLANELDALFIEESEGLRSLDDVRREFSMLYTRELSTAWIQYGAPQIRASAERTIHKQWGAPLVVSGLRDLQAA